MRAQPQERCRSALHVEREDPLTSQPYITCQQLIDFIGRYRDDELDAQTRNEFDRHLSVCPSCVAYLKTFEQTVLLAKASAQDPAPPDVPESLVKAILEAKPDAT